MEDRIIEKLYTGKELMPIECEMCADGEVGSCVDETEGHEGRWVRYMKTIFKIGADLWAVEWGRGLTEMQENEYYWQPYRVKEVRKQVTITTVEYEKVTE